MTPEELQAQIAELSAKLQEQDEKIATLQSSHSLHSDIIQNHTHSTYDKTQPIDLRMNVASDTFSLPTSTTSNFTQDLSVGFTPSILILYHVTVLQNTEGSVLQYGTATGSGSNCSVIGTVGSSADGSFSSSGYIFHYSAATSGQSLTATATTWDSTITLTFVPNGTHGFTDIESTPLLWIAMK